MNEVSQETMMFKRQPEKKYMPLWRLKVIILLISWQVICLAVILLILPVMMTPVPSCAVTNAMNLLRNWSSVT